MISPPLPTKIGIDFFLMWYYNKEEVTELPAKVVGFVYVIENLTNGRKYFGKKSAQFKKYKSVKGKKKSFMAESDWREYFGSSDILKADVDLLGEDQFKKTILKYCFSKSELSYYELKYQIENDVLLKPNEYYNEWVCAKITRKHMSKYLI